VIVFVLLDDRDYYGPDYHSVHATEAAAKQEAERQGFGSMYEIYEESVDVT